MTDDLVKRLWESDEASALTNQAARRIEQLKAENKLLSEGATIAHLRGAIDAHANRADDIWEAHKHWEGERKFALRQIVRWLKNTPGGKAEGE
jgi:hypothetical protein